MVLKMGQDLNVDGGFWLWDGCSKRKDIETLNRENAKVKSLFDENQSDSII